MKVKLFTHTDLDGVGCAIVAKSAFENVSVEYCDYKEIDMKINYFLKSVKANDYDRVFITDISVDEGTAELINTHPLGKQKKIQLIDHHGTALWLAEKYDWAEVRVEESNLGLHDDPREQVKSSGTSLFYKFLRNKNLPNIEPNIKLKSFAENVRLYDTWEWYNIFKDNHPKRLNDLLYIIGREKFVERFVSNPTPTFTDTELTILEIEEHRINKYIWYKKKDVKIDTVLVQGRMYKFAYVFAEQHSSLLGNSIAEDYGNEIDFVVIFDIGNNKVSLRGIHDNIDLGKEIAKNYGGGGHAKASGFETNPIFQKFIMRNILGIQKAEEVK